MSARAVSVGAWDTLVALVLLLVGAALLPGCTTILGESPPIRPDEQAAYAFVEAAADADGPALSDYMGRTLNDAEITLIQRKVNAFPKSSYSTIECDLESREDDRVVFRCNLASAANVVAHQLRPTRLSSVLPLLAVYWRGLFYEQRNGFSCYPVGPRNDRRMGNTARHTSPQTQAPTR